MYLKRMTDIPFHRQQKCRTGILICSEYSNESPVFCFTEVGSVLTSFLGEWLRRTGMQTLHMMQYTERGVSSVLRFVGQLTQAFGERDSGLPAGDRGQAVDIAAQSHDLIGTVGNFAKA